MKSPYGNAFDGSAWPWELSGDEDWFAFVDANGRYISDACVEGTAAEFRDLAHALRGRHNYRVRRLAARLNGHHYEFCSPRNTVGGYALLPVELSDALADIIDKRLKEDKP